MTRYSVRVESRDGSAHFDWPDDQRKAYQTFSNRVRDAGQGVALIQLRRHEPDGAVTILNQKDGPWLST
jgi:hypothetical protein